MTCLDFPLAAAQAPDLQVLERCRNRRLMIATENKQYKVNKENSTLNNT
jgi:hypothetical protein